MLIRNGTALCLYASCWSSTTGERGLVYRILPGSFSIVLGPEIGQEQCGRFGRATISAHVVCVPSGTVTKSEHAPVGPGVPHEFSMNGLTVLISVEPQE